MNRDIFVKSATLNDIIRQKLEGIINKVDLAKSAAEDDQLQADLQAVLAAQDTVGELLKETAPKS